MERLTFPKDFTWGCATASFQIEGAYNEDDKGESIWDRFCAIPGNVRGGATGETACDHYHRFKEDVAIMKQLGMKAYRFSISWPRILPQGHGAVNEKGLAFYDALLDELLAAGIEPYITLYHWDLPQPLQDIGGWVNPLVAEYFLEYAKVVMDRFSGKVKHWMTLNEPFCVTHLGYAIGIFAPGVRDFSASLAALYNLYVGHGLAVDYFRKAGLPGKIGIALNPCWVRPASDAPEDIAAAKRAEDYQNHWFMDPLFKGSFPKELAEYFVKKGVRLPEVKAADLKLMSQPLDFVGINYYSVNWMAHDPSYWPLDNRGSNPAHLPTNDREWSVVEEGLTELLVYMKEEYGVQHLIVSENGASFHDLVTLDGRVEDGPRKEYLRRHIGAVHKAIAQGAPVEGYLVWSLCDNFEWQDGYGCRFGIVHIDFNTLKRTVKDSALWYSQVIAQNGLTE